MKALVISLCVLGALAVSIGITAGVCLNHYVGTPECVGEVNTKYKIDELHVEHDDVDIYGKTLVPAHNDGEKLPLVIYAHGADSDYKADYTTLKSLAMSGIACYTFDFYGWTSRSTGPKGAKWFKGTSKLEDDAYVTQLFSQVDDLNAVIEKCKTLDFVDTSNIYLLGSSMGGATVATCATTHSDDIRSIVLQYPAINLNKDAMIDDAEYDVNKYTRDILLLQGNVDKIVPLSMSEELRDHCNKYNKEHCKMRVYNKQPHVFTGKYKVIAARATYEFIKDEMEKNI